MSAVIVVSPEQLASIVREAVAAELDTRGMKAPEPDEPDVFESVGIFMRDRMGGLSKRTGYDWIAQGKLATVGEGRSLRVDVTQSLIKIRGSKKKDTCDAIERLARRDRRAKGVAA